jgi:hypothetical protein
MSKLKTPREKKEASLEHDRRNVYFENDKSSRKNIPRSKKLSHQAERRAANQPLAKLKDKVDEEEGVAAELESRVQFKKKRGAGFRKHPDAKLKDVIHFRQTGEWPPGSR